MGKEEEAAVRWRGAGVSGGGSMGRLAPAVAYRARAAVSRPCPGRRGPGTDARGCGQLVCAARGHIIFVK